MKEWGITLIFIGLGSFVLPMIGLQFRLLNLFGGSPAAGVLVAAIGGILFAVGFMKERAQISPGAKRTDSGSQSQAPNRAVSEPRNRSITDTGTRCSACGAENAQGDQFCGSCGTVLAQIKSQPSPSCVRCGNPLSLDERFCGECGEPVVAQALAAEPKVTAARTSATPQKSRRIAAILGTIIVFIVTALYYTKEQPLPPASQPAPRPAAKPLQQSKEQPGVPPATRIGPYQYGGTSNDQKAITPPSETIIPSERGRSVPPAPRLGPQAYEPQVTQDVRNTPGSPRATIPESLPSVQSPPQTTNSGKTTDSKAISAIDLRGIWKGESYCPYLNMHTPFSVNVTEQRQNTFTGFFSFNNTPFRGNLRGDQVTLEHHVATQQEQRWDGQLIQVAGATKMEGSTVMVAASTPPCSFELSKQ
jgi:hypothetical protein